MKNLSAYFAVLALGCFGVVSCAEEKEVSSKDMEQKVLEAHVSVVHKDTLTKTASGLYYTPLANGTGARITDTAVVFVRETTYDMNYNITGSTDEQVARQLGDFSTSNSYEPLLWFTHSQAIMMGLEEMLLEMREGDTRRIWLPYWLSSYYEGGTSSNTSTVVYDLTLDKVVYDIDKYQIENLESFKNAHYPGLDSLMKGYYSKDIVVGTGDTIAYGETVKAYYVGKLLNGFTFDTNVADTATKYFISCGETTDWTIPEAADWENGRFIGESDGMTSIEGFTKCLMGMRYGGVSICFFHSEFGYDSDGSSSSSTGTYINGGYGIQPYTPLFFWLYVPLDQD